MTEHGAVDYPAYAAVYSPPSAPLGPVAAGAPQARRPGIIPLRPLTLSDIFNAAFSYARASPKTTLGLTTVVVVAAQVVVLAFTSVVTFSGSPASSVGESSQLNGVSAAEVIGMVVAGLVDWLSLILLSGMLTVVVGRAVFGERISIGAAWEQLRGRLGALTGLAVLEAVGAAALIAVSVFVVAAAAALSPAAAVLIGLPVAALVIAALIWLWTVLTFAPALVVLERMPVFGAIGRSVSLIRGSFWRVLGISGLGLAVAEVITLAVAGPFTVAGSLLSAAAGSTAGAIGGMVLAAAGNVIGQIVTAPFTAGVAVLLYADRRMRAEAFDLVLQTGASDGAVASGDHLWLIRQP